MTIKQNLEEKQKNWCQNEIMEERTKSGTYSAPRITIVTAISLTYLVEVSLINHGIRNKAFLN
jgi:hypothetical protein